MKTSFVASISQLIPDNSAHQGILQSLPAEEYHSNPAIGHSSLLKLMRSPAHYIDYATSPRKPTPAKQLGSAFHAALLEPEVFKQSYVVAPKFDRRTKDGKSQAEAWETANAEKTALSAEQMESILKMTSAAQEHKGAKFLLAQGEAEMSGFWTDQETGIACKIRPDFLAKRGELITGLIDIKTCVDSSREVFAKSIAKFGYDVQAAYYTDGLEKLTGRKVGFYFIAIENDAPHATAVYEASLEMIEIGRAKYRAALELLQWCRKEGYYPSYQPAGEIERIDLPRWASSFTLED